MKYRHPTKRYKALQRGGCGLLNPIAGCATNGIGAVLVRIKSVHQRKPKRKHSPVTVLVMLVISQACLEDDTRKVQSRACRCERLRISKTMPQQLGTHKRTDTGQIVSWIGAKGNGISESSRLATIAGNHSHKQGEVSFMVTGVTRLRLPVSTTIAQASEAVVIASRLRSMLEADSCTCVLAATHREPST